jgi:hypothetical protein
MDCLGANVGHTCGAGQICMAASCVTSCTAGQVACGGACIDPTSNRSYCGASGSCTGMSAGSACAAGQVCIGSACQALPCPTGQIACGMGCVDPNVSSQFCGASGDCSGMHVGTACRFDQYCSSGHCVETFGRYSYLSPGTLTTDQTRARPTHFTVGTAFPATFYYTLDGSTPTPGTPATHTSPSPLDLGVLGDGAQVRWYADFGTPFGPEPLVHALNFHVAPSPHSLGQIVEGLRILGGSGFGPVAVAARGATLTISASFEYWKSDSMGYCPGCVVYWGINFAGQVPTTAPFCAPVSTPYTAAVSGGGMTAFTAPSTPGRYPIYSSEPLDFHCDPGGEEIGEVFVF